MTQSALAERVQKHDPDRYLASQAVPMPQREDLFTLYALNLEIARLPWLTDQPLIAEMRLQWWRDLIADPKPRAHDLAGPVHSLIRKAALPVELLDQMIAARRWDIYSDPFSTGTEFDTYIDQTSGHLMWLSARVLGAHADEEIYIRNVAYAAGIEKFLTASHQLQTRGKQPLTDRTDAGICALALLGLERLDAARRVKVGKSASLAALAGWQAGPILRLAQRKPALVQGGGLVISEFTRRFHLLRQSVTGRV